MPRRRATRAAPPAARATLRRRAPARTRRRTRPRRPAAVRGGGTRPPWSPSFPTTGQKSSLVPRSAASREGSPASSFLWTASITTTASSMTSPTATASPPSVIRFNVCPNAPSTSSDAPSVSGRDIAAIAVARVSRRKSASTAMANRAAKQDGVPHAVHAVGDEHRLLVHRGDPHTGGKRRRQLREPLTNGAIDGEDVPADPTRHVDDRARLSIDADDARPRLHALQHPPEVSNPERLIRRPHPPPRRRARPRWRARR